MTWETLFHALKPKIFSHSLKLIISFRSIDWGSYRLRRVLRTPKMVVSPSVHPSIHLFSLSLHYMSILLYIYIYYIYKYSSIHPPVSRYALHAPSPSLYINRYGCKSITLPVYPYVLTHTPHWSIYPFICSLYLYTTVNPFVIHLSRITELYGFLQSFNYQSVALSQIF